MNKKIHLAHVIPSPSLHIFHGYDEIIETIRWGLVSLGYDVTYAVNRPQPNCTNIVFGAQMLRVEELKRLPANTIIYNLEQMADLQPEEIRESLRYCGEHLQVWDYSEFNLPSWRSLNPPREPINVPVGYSAVLSRIPKPANQEIDVLFYGGPGGPRLRIFAELCAKLVKAVFVHGLYGAARDALISNSKLIVNLGQYPQQRIFEIARASYLLANSKAIVSDRSSASKIEPDIENAVRFCPLDQVVQECLNLLDDAAARNKLERDGFEIMSRRDIRTLLAPAIANL
jgi:hypothetical protein